MIQLKRFFQMEVRHTLVSKPFTYVLISPLCHLHPTAKTILTRERPSSDQRLKSPGKQGQSLIRSCFTDLSCPCLSHGRFNKNGSKHDSSVFVFLRNVSQKSSTELEVILTQTAHFHLDQQEAATINTHHHVDEKRAALT